MDFGAWAYALIVLILAILGVKIAGLAKDKGKHEAEDKAAEEEGKRIAELAKRQSDDHDINSHFGVRDNTEGKDSKPPPRFEVSHSDNSSD
jgi:hypothetical protein